MSGDGGQGTAGGIVLNLSRGPAGGRQSYFQSHHKREAEDAFPPKKRPKTAHAPEAKQDAVTPADAGRETDHSPKPSAGNEGDTPNEEKKEIVTSLFTGNPAIPFIPKSDVTKLSEKVFSEESFSSLDLAPQIVSNLEKLGFTSMTSVQQQAIPSILGGKDTLVKSQTGSGKTLTYALPILHSLMMQVPRVQRSDGVLALVVVPTRELALQSYQWFEKLHKSCVWVVPGYLIGGEKKKAEKARLRRGINILVGTPGRLIDHLHSTRSLSLASVRFLVIDEADRLLDMGYERSITSIIETLHEQQPGAISSRQTIMLSATLSAGVEKLAGMSLVEPKVVDVSCEDSTESQLTSEALATPANLSHHYLLVPAKLRLVTLAAFILSKCKCGDERKMIIFFATQDMVDYHTALFSKVLSRYGQEVKSKTSLLRRAEKVLAGEEDDGEGSHDEEDVEEEEEEEEELEQGKSRERPDVILFQKLHGSMTQQDRSAVFKSFKDAAAGVLMCTDVASRGLDMPKVRWIVQFSAACTAADYVHRVGRTARVNALGSALVFLAPAEAPYIQMLESHKITLKEINMQGVLRNLMLPLDPNSRKPVANTMEEAATKLQLQIEKLLLSDSGFRDLARKAYVSFVRSYASYPKEVREMFNFKALHLGHYAKSMGLRDSPAALGAGAAFRAKKEMKERREKKEKKRKIQVMNQRCGNLPKTASMSEFDSGLDSMPKNKTKTKTKKKIK